jgi:4-hydroxybenzoate polyprenyltransferase
LTQEWGTGTTVRGVFRAIRVFQWSKNLLLFVPPLCAHAFQAPAPWLACFAGFLLFSIASSGQYLVNDLIDAETDRAHPVKRARPIAAGELSAGAASALAALLIAASMTSAALLSARFAALLAAYHVSAFAYSRWIKRLAMADVLLLTGLYALRIFAGGTLAGVPISGWLVAFSGFLFFSLALLKRYSEIRMGGPAPLARRAYRAANAWLLESLGISSGLLSVLVLVLYVQHPQVAALYSHPRRLWLLCPALAYWLGRMWLVAHRGGMREDPVSYTVTDPVAYLVLSAAGAVFLSAL